MRLIIIVTEIKGKCPVYRVGDRITLKDGYILDPGAGDAVCLHSLASVLPYYVALSHGVRPQDLGLARGEEAAAYVNCLDPCEITGGGRVVLKITRVSD